jgi:hypothetical protein
MRGVKKAPANVGAVHRSLTLTLALPEGEGMHGGVRDPRFRGGYSH